MTSRLQLDKLETLHKLIPFQKFEIAFLKLFFFFQNCFFRKIGICFSKLFDFSKLMIDEGRDSLTFLSVPKWDCQMQFVI